MKSMLRTTLLVVVSALAGAVVAVMALTGPAPSTASLDADLASVRGDIRSAEQDVSRLGGLAAVQANLRLQVLRTTEAMLEQKRLRFLRGIRLVHQADFASPTVSADTTLRLHREIEATRADLARAEAEASRYVGGLILDILRVRIETTRATLAVLEQQEILARHGLVPPSLRPSIEGATPVGRTPGVAVPDRDALQ